MYFILPAISKISLLLHGIKILKNFNELFYIVFFHRKSSNTWYILALTAYLNLPLAIFPVLNSHTHNGSGAGQHGFISPLFLSFCLSFAVATHLVGMLQAVVASGDQH